MMSSSTCPRAAFPALGEYARHHSPDLLAELAKANQFDAVKKDRDQLEADVHLLTAELKQSEADRAARLEVIEKLDKLLKESEADRAARLDVIERQDALLKEQAARLEALQKEAGANK